MQRRVVLLSSRLNNPPELDALKRDDAILSALKALEDGSEDLYKHSMELLNLISRKIRDEFVAEEELIKFIQVNEMIRYPGEPRQRYHPKSFPKVVAVTESTADALEKANLPPAWHHMISLIDDDSEHHSLKLSAGGLADGNTGTFLGYLAQSRPDMAALLGLAVSPIAFGVCFSYPAGVEVDYGHSWEPTDVRVLIAYVYTLYKPQPIHNWRDTTVTLSKKVSVSDPPLWDVDCGDGTVYRECIIFGSGDPWSKMTTVFCTPSDPPIMIKDSHLLENYSKEREIYEVLQKDGKPAPGFVHMDRGFDVLSQDGEVVCVHSKGHYESHKWVKSRLVLTTSGDRMSKNRSLVDFLKNMYDTVEAHRYAVKEKNILHRDLSWSNILRLPKEAMPLQIDEHDPTRPKFIDEVLDSTKKCAPPRILIIDLDCATEYDFSKAQSPSLKAKYDGYPPGEHLTLLVGTPQSIARTVAVGHLLNDVSTDVKPIPTLEGHARKLYLDAHGSSPEALRTLEDTEDTIHGVKPPSATDREKSLYYLQDKFQFHPRHDVESIYWNIIFYFLSIAPEQNIEKKLPDTHNEDFNALWRFLAGHEFSAADPSIPDSRRLIPTVRNWKKFLHEELGFLEPLLVELSELIEPEYGFFPESLDVFHLHEGMQRILLKYIWKFGGGGEGDGVEAKDLSVCFGREIDPYTPLTECELYWDMDDIFAALMDDEEDEEESDEKDEGDEESVSLKRGSSDGSNSDSEDEHDEKEGRMSKRQRL
ncbi:hypothetical protein ONZ45_g14228 [Pleurotus djamor]|nr:hypothetical protein ONZ45_g14228 [Pleurotus djamor]